MPPEEEKTTEETPTPTEAADSARATLAEPATAPEQPAQPEASKEPDIPITPRMRMNRAFTMWAAECPKFPASMKGNANDHYVVGAFGQQAVLNPDKKGNPQKCQPKDIDSARAYLDVAVQTLREQLTVIVKQMVEILDLKL